MVCGKECFLFTGEETAHPEKEPIGIRSHEGIQERFGEAAAADFVQCRRFGSMLDRVEAVRSAARGPVRKTALLLQEFGLSACSLLAVAS